MENNINEEGRTELKGLGFIAEGCNTVNSLLKNGVLDRIPKEEGVYVVLCPDGMEPEFISWPFGDLYEKRDKNTDEKKSHPLMYDLNKLENSWISDTSILYIGKTNDLNDRIKTYLRYYNKLQECQNKNLHINNVAHRGGRSIWQIKDAENLIVAWMPTPGKNAREVEAKMIQDFKSKYKGKHPFANKID